MLKRLLGPLFWFLFSVVCGWILLFQVDLTPEVDREFFFSSNAPQLRVIREIEHLFPTPPLIVFTAFGDIVNPDYRSKIVELTEKLENLPDAQNVISLANGPDSIQDAKASPLWSRIVLGEERNSSNIFIFLTESYQRGSLERIQALRDEYHSENFQLAISGIPYVIFLIQKNLTAEIRRFSWIAFAMAALVMSLLFRSFWIVSGSLVACASATFVLFLSFEMLSLETGVLSANLWTIAFVLTLSHVVFITANWTLRDHDVHQAVLETRQASGWAMVTTLLGFLTLVPTAAKPVRQFGWSGAFATLISYIAAYLIFPRFLRMARSTPKSTRASERKHEFFRQLSAAMTANKKAPVWIILLVGILAIPGVFRVNWDPHLFEYFDPGGPLRQSLIAIDRAGGSSPLQIVVRTKNNAPLNTDEGYIRLWEYQLDLEEHPSVGQILSLPVIMSELVTSSLAPLLSWELIIDLLESPLFGKIGEGFITSDRKLGLYFIRMKESLAPADRDRVVAELKQLAANRGLEPILVGGIYSLQGQLSKLVRLSVLQGLAGLFGLFFLIIWYVSRSIRVAAAVVGSMLLVPLGVLGIGGHFALPMDLVSIPAFNVAVAIGIDDIIHLLLKTRQTDTPYDWGYAKKRLWKAVLASTLIVSLGFGTFQFSDFPSTERLGIFVVVGSILAVVVSLYVVPQAIQLTRSKSQSDRDRNQAIAS